MVIVRVGGPNPGSPVNGQVVLDGCDTLWVKGITFGSDNGQFVWPSRV